MSQCANLSIFLLQWCNQNLYCLPDKQSKWRCPFHCFAPKNTNLIIKINPSIIPATLDDFIGNCLIIHSLQTVFAKLLYCRYSLSPHGFQYEFRHYASGLNMKRRNEPLIMINKRIQRGLNMQLHYKALCSVWNNCRTDIKRRNWQHSLWVGKTLQQHRNH